jgi:hypothetical protein
MRRIPLILMVLTTVALSGCDLRAILDESFAVGEAPTPVVIVVTSTPVPTATAIPLPTLIPSPTPEPCIARTDWPVYTVVRGDTLYAIARRVGSTVEALTAANCLANPRLLHAGQALRVPVLPAPAAVPPPDCPIGVYWFFEFKAGQSPIGCPNPVEVRSAVGEDFEGGRVYWYAAAPADPDQRGTLYVIYNDYSWESYVNTWDPSQPASDPSIVPPAGRYQPMRAIGKLWRENATVRTRLGWAYEPESAFTGRLQTINTRVGDPPPGYVPHFYIDHGKGIVLRLYNPNMMSNTWEIIGGYTVAPVPTPPCGVQWFFAFQAGQADPLCPNPVQTTSAAGEDFEGGRVYWYAAAPGSPDPRGTLYVIYNDGTWETFVDTWDESQPASDPSIVPPAGRYQPERGIGKVWRENADVRARLGWAYEPESAFTGRRQTPAATANYSYVDHGKGIVLRLYSVDMGPNTWEVAGSY